MEERVQNEEVKMERVEKTRGKKALNEQFTHIYPFLPPSLPPSLPRSASSSATCTFTRGKSG